LFQKIAKAKIVLKCALPYKYCAHFFLKRNWPGFLLSGQAGVCLDMLEFFLKHQNNINDQAKHLLKFLFH